jgi:hypothetical protein
MVVEIKFGTLKEIINGRKPYLNNGIKKNGMELLVYRLNDIQIDDERVKLINQLIRLYLNS